jgi:hypothetical protein
MHLVRILLSTPEEECRAYPCLRLLFGDGRSRPPPHATIDNSPTLLYSVGTLFPCLRLSVFRREEITDAVPRVIWAAEVSQTIRGSSPLSSHIPRLRPPLASRLAMVYRCLAAMVMLLLV